MTAVASIKFTHGTDIGTAGQALVSAASTLPVIIQNGSNTDVTYYKIILIDGPAGFGTANGTILAEAAGNTPYAELPWTATTYGTARVRLILNQTDVPAFNENTTIYDDRDFIAPTPDGYKLPAFKSDSSSFNYGGQALGWKTDVNAIISALRYSTNHIGSFRCVADNTARDAIAAHYLVSGQTIVYVISTNKWWRWNGSAFVEITATFTLAGDASGASDSNIVTHVTGTTNTEVHGTSSVKLTVNSTDTVTADTNGMLLLTTRFRTGSGAPASSDPNGSFYLRTDGTSTTTAYIRVSGAWVSLGPSATVTLAGDASGDPTSNTVTNVTGTINTLVSGTTTVKLRVNSVDTVTADSDGMLLKTTRVRTGSGAPAAADPNGSFYLRTDGTETSTAYIRASSAWVPLSTGAGTLAGDVTGATSDNDIVRITGDTTGTAILHPTSHPTAAPSTGVLMFPSKGDPSDTYGNTTDRGAWRWLQANGACPVMKGFYLTANAGTTTTLRLITFDTVADNTNLQGFYGRLHILLTPVNSAATRAYCEWTIPVHAFGYYDDGLAEFTVHVHTVTTASLLYDATANWQSSTLNSGFSYGGRTAGDTIVVMNEYYGGTRALSRTTGAPANQLNVNVNGATLIYGEGGTSPSRVLVDITPPESTGFDNSTNGWNGTFYSRSYRIRGWIEGVWSIESNRISGAGSLY